MLHFSSGFACYTVRRTRSNSIRCLIWCFCIPKRIADASNHIISHKTTDISCSIYDTCTIRIGDGCHIIISQKTTDLAITCYASCTIRIADDSITIIISHKPTDLAITCYASCIIRITDVSLIINSNKSTDKIFSCDICISYAKIFYFSIRSIYITK